MAQKISKSVNQRPRYVVYDKEGKLIDTFRLKGSITSKFINKQVTILDKETGKKELLLPPKKKTKV